MATSTAIFNPLRLRLPPSALPGEAGFLTLCQSNPDYRIERSATGEIEIMPPTGGETGHKNLQLLLALGNWAANDGTGVVFDSSTGFTLPNGATRSPDAAWVRRERLAALTAGQKKGFLPLAPDFVVELLSSTDNLRVLQTKMEEYRENGVQLGWLIDPEGRRVFVYTRPDAVQTLVSPALLSGDPVLPGFVLAIEPIWREGF